MMKNRYVKRIVSVGLAGALAVSLSAPAFAASPQVAPAAKKVAVKSVKLNYTTKTLKKGKTFTLKATISPKNASNKKVSWKSSKKSVATVSAKGKVKAIKNGKAKITAITKSGKKKASCTVTVGTPVTKVKLSAAKKTIKVGKTATLKATVSPKNASNKNVTWKSSKTSVATVTSKGKVTAKAAGSATITATAKDGSGKKGTCKVTVPAVPVSSVKLNPTTATLVPRATVKLSATVSPANATNKTLTWKSSTPAVATVNSSGLVTAVAAGTANITATSNNKKVATCTVKVTQPVTGVTLDKDTADVYVGYTETLTATVVPANATNKTVTWASSNTDSATVDANGVVTGVAADNGVTITATTVDGAKKATCTVDVLNNAAGAAITTPAVKDSVTATTITVTAAEAASNDGNQAIEYAVNNSGTLAPTTGWQTTLTFTGLNPAGDYYVWARTQAKEGYAAGDAVVSAEINTNSHGALIDDPATLNTKTHNSITVNTATVASGAQTIEYAIDEDDTVAPESGWQTTLTFTGLDPATNYYVWARTQAESGYDAGTAKASDAITTDKAPGAAITTAATADSTTYKSITVTAAEASTNPGSQTIEYAINDSSSTAPTADWQAGLTFTDLDADTTYYVWARTAENDSYDAGTASASAAITTPDIPAKDELAKITEIGIKTVPFGTANTQEGVEAALLTNAQNLVADGYTVSIEDGSTYDDSSKAWSGQFTVAADDDALINVATDSSARNYTIEFEVESIPLNGVTYSVKDGTLSSTAINMQYSIAGGGWADCADTTTSNITFAAGDVKIRQKDKISNEHTVGTIAAAAAAPNGVTIAKADGQTAGTTTAMEWSLDESTWTAFAADNALVSGLASETTVYVRTAATADALPSQTATITTTE